MNCPRCFSPLVRKPVRDFEVVYFVDHCEKCGGSWFHNDQLSAIEKTIEPTFIEIRNIPPAEEQVKTLSCPSCGPGNALQKAEHPRDRKVIFDYCPSCKGIWLDSGELEAIQKENWILTVGKFFKWLISNN